MSSIGERLREERLRRGLGVEQIAEQLKINPSMLTAIETGNLDRLPGGFFRRSFVRQYARALGIPSEEIEAELKRIDGDEAQPTMQQSEIAFRPEIDRRPVTPASSPSRMGGPQPLGSLIAFLLIVAACTGIYALWERTRDADTGPATAARQAPAAAKRPQASQPAPVAGVQQPAPPTQEPAESGSVPPSSPSPLTDEPEPAQRPTPSAPVRLEMRAATEVWVRIREGGTVLFEGTLQPGVSRTFEGQKAVIARIGRPGAVTVTWNGKPTGTLGPAESPITLEFTPETFRIVPRQPSAEPQPADAP